MRVLVVDNYDSFVYILVQYLGELGAEPIVYRNDAITVPAALDLEPDAVLISPGVVDSRRGAPHSAQKRLPVGELAPQAEQVTSPAEVPSSAATARSATAISSALW